MKLNLAKLIHMEIDDTPYWHLVPTKGLFKEIFYNNVSVGKGVLFSISAGIEAEPNIKNAHTPYSLNRINDHKERVFEEVRANKYPDRPSRMKAIYLFSSIEMAERAQSQWFNNDPKQILEVRIIKGSIVHYADANWLNCKQEGYHTFAERYWSGEMGDNPFLEVILHGAVYFPGWKCFPIAKFD